MLCAERAWADEASDWHTVHRERGIVVSTRKEPGSSLPSFRGQAELPGSVLHILAIVIDDARAKEWSKDAEEAVVLRKIDPRTQLVYSRARQAWPVQDRDLVMKRTIEVIKPEQEFRVRLLCVPGEKPTISKVVRMTDCETVFWLRKIDATTTFVEFRVRADPGGNSPDWLVRWASKNIPVDTLVALRKQIHKTKDSYAAVIREWERAR
jgi:hypothetical protein